MGSDNSEDSADFYGNDDVPDNDEEKKQIENIPLKSDIHKSKPIKKFKRRGHRDSQKPKTSKEDERQKKKQEEALKTAETLIEEMQKRFDQDQSAFKNEKPANKKLMYVGTVAKELKNSYTLEKFIELNGMELFELWFSKLPNGKQPSLSLRKDMLKILQDLKFKSDHLTKITELQRIVQKHKKCESKELRDLSEAILLKWSIALHDYDNE